MKSILVLLVCAFVLLFLPRSIAAQSATIDSRVLADTADGKVGRFLVVLKAQTQTRALVAAIADRAARGRLVFEALRRNADATQASLRAQLNALNVKHRVYWIVNVVAAEGNRNVVTALAARTDVLAIESDREFRVPLEPPSSVPAAPNAVEWNVNKIGAPPVWNAGFTGQGIVYANADTGVQWDHPALVSHYRGWDGGTADHNYNWWDAIHSGNNPCNANNPSNPLPASGSPTPCDPYGHGTHTLGTGIGDDGAGNQIGVAPGAKWISCRNMNSAGFGTPSTYLECFQFFLAPTDLSGNNPDVSKRPDVVSNSYGCPPSEGCSVNSLLTAMDNLRAAGIFMATSAGNGGPSCSTVSDPPAIYDSAITIGATDSNDAIAAFSSRGSVTIDASNRRKPDLVAPGVGVRSSYPVNAYAGISGTSMAAPHVAGAVALLWSAFPALRGDIDATETLLARTAVRLATSQTCGGDTAFQYPNNVFGFGRIDVWAAYDYESQPIGFKYRFPMVSHNP